MIPTRVLGGHPPLRRLAPAAPRTALTDSEADLHTGALTAVVNALGGKHQLADMLAVAGDAPEVEPLLALMADPRYDHLSLRRLCDLAGWSVVDLFAAWRKAALVRAHLLAYQAITANLLPVVEDVMRRAAPYQIPCPACKGAGDIPIGDSATARATCTSCRGHGEVLQLPDIELQKLALELAQLAGRERGLLIQQTVNVDAAQTASGMGSLVELQQAVRLLVSGPRTPLSESASLADRRAEVPPLADPPVPVAPHADPPAVPRELDEPVPFDPEAEEDEVDIDDLDDDVEQPAESEDADEDDEDTADAVPEGPAK